MIGGLSPHLGSRVSALLDGRLSAVEEERAWEHVHHCPPCRDLVEREGAIKTELACWSMRAAPAPGGLRESLLSSDSVALAAMAGRAAETLENDQSRVRNVVVMGGSALGMAFVGVFAFATAPSDAPMPGPSPVTSLTTTLTSGPTPGPSREASPVVDVVVRTRGPVEAKREPNRAVTTSIGGTRLRVSEVVVSGTMSR